MMFDAYLQWLQQSTPAQVRAWIGPERLRRRLQADLERTLASRFHSGRNAAAYARRCPVPGVAADDYRLREFHLGDRGALLAGIHFRNLDPAHPFVGVYAQTRALPADEVETISALLGREFARFRPPRVQWWCAAEQEDLRKIPGAVGDQRLLMGHLKELEDITLGAIPEPVSLRQDPDGRSFSAYARLFDEFLGRYPRWRGRIAKTDHAVYAECAAQGSLCLVEIDRRFAGVIAARPGEIRGIRGWEMVEEILAPRYRGRGIAPYLQRRFLGTLDRRRGSLVLGTIDEENLPSIRTALRVGRLDVGGWVFVPTGL